MKTLNIGIIGAGGVARAAHMPSYAGNSKVQVMAVADPDILAAKSLAEEYSIPMVVEDYHEMLDDPTIEAVDICAPHYLHYPMTMDALNQGKHVILEKPISMNLEEADRMIEAANELGLWLLVVLNQRFMPVHRKVKEMLNDGRLGKPFLLNANITGDLMLLMNDASHWKGTWDRAGGGAFFDSGSHIVDLMHYWFGKPTAVSATMKRLLVSQENKAEDTAAVTFEYGDDLIANLTVSYAVENEPWSEKKFIYGTGGDISMINEVIVPMFFISNGSPSIIEVDHRADWWPWSHDLALRNFVNCIMENAEPLVTAEDARAALKTIQYAYQSAQESRRVVID